MLKADLRKKYLTERKSLSLEEVENRSLKIVDLLKNMDWNDKDKFHLFLPIKKNKEPNTFLILKLLEELEKTILIPKTDFKKIKMLNYIYEGEEQLKVNKYGIAEPQKGILVNDQDIQVVFVPLLCADKKGYRVGYGGGFYDRFLANCNPNCITIGISLFPEIDNISDVNQYDIALDMLVTPVEIINYKIKEI